MQIWKFSPISICSVIIWPSAPGISLETVLAYGQRVPATGVLLRRCKFSVSGSHFVNGLTVGRGSCCSEWRWIRGLLVKGWTLWSSNCEALTSVFCKRCIRRERTKRGRFLNRTAKEYSIKGRRVGQTPHGSAGEMMEPSVNPKGWVLSALANQEGGKGAEAGVSVEMPPPQSCVLCSPFFWYGSVLSNLLIFCKASPQPLFPVYQWRELRWKQNVMAAWQTWGRGVVTSTLTGEGGELALLFKFAVWIN